ncbi:N-acetyltransferase [Tsukamurella pseudospumae]|uniref:N-acetyltransferase domain-containing protein n=1 Tax=Tsukamurella pseudospumae TaxID=239498 RepID=A0A137ZZC0_9ACTN|nr:N-acetyltransferase [Tsukamurella pseudospumae]KXP03502.1 hypothetical protein AXK60_16925 [Tsukamurella pseudospumae]
MTEPAQFRLERLTEEHHTSYFDCGVKSLDDWLASHALDEQDQGRSCTHVWADAGGCVVAYFTLLPTTIVESDPGIMSILRPARFPRTSDLCGVLLGKLALDQSLRRQGRGNDLLAEAFVTAYEAVQLIGGVHLVTDPRDEVRGFYLQFGFVELEGTKRMFLPMREFAEGGTPL